MMHKNGILLLSGFFITDAESLIKKATQYNLKHIKTKNKEEWAMLMFEMM
jgi:ribosomal protein L11 methylase PrmA